MIQYKLAKTEQLGQSGNLSDLYSGEGGVARARVRITAGVLIIFTEGISLFYLVPEGEFWDSI